MHFPHTEYMTLGHASLFLLLAKTGNSQDVHETKATNLKPLKQRTTSLLTLCVLGVKYVGDKFRGDDNSLWITFPPIRINELDIGLSKNTYEVHV